MNNNEKYDDIINLPHHVSKKHPQMSLEARSAQFAPFAALTGYDEEVKETGRLTNKRKDIDEELKVILDSKLQLLLKQIDLRPIVSITYFLPDDKKDGGIYTTVTDNVRKIDEYMQLIICDNGTKIPISEIIDIQF